MEDKITSILLNDEHYAKIRLTKRMLDRLEEARVFSSHDKGAGGWQVGSELTFRRHIRLQPYTGYLEGRYLYPLGCYSYSHSELTPDMEVGRYCSIGAGLQCHGHAHPISSVTSSLAICDQGVQFMAAAMRDRAITRLAMVSNPQKHSPAIGNDVWIGANVTLMRGIRIGDGAVVAAASLVTRDVPAYAVVGGNPAKLIRWRFPEEIRTELSALAWWRYDLADLQDLDFAQPERFIRDLEERAGTIRPWHPVAFHLWEAVLAEEGVAPARTAQELYDDVLGTLAERGDLARARDMAESMMQLYPDNWLGFDAGGHCAEEADNREAALHYTRRAVELNPAYPPLLQRLAAVSDRLAAERKAAGQ